MSHNRSVRVPSRLAVVVALVVAALTVVSGLSTPAHAQTSTTWVSPTGSDTNAGTEAAPFKTLQKALDAATTGTTINLKAGTYREAVITKRAGTAAAPIKIKGPVEGRDKAVLYGLGGRVFSIDHSYYTLEGFTIDGQQNIARSEYEGKTLSQVRGFKDSVQGRAVNSKLVYVGATNTTADIVGVTISNMFLTGSGGECVRFRNRAANSLVVNSLIQWCGMLGQGIEPDQYKYHNAEGVYIGTSPKSTTQPMYENDTSNNIVVRDSTINTFGSECFEVKENAHHNRMENVDCGYNDEPLAQQGSNVELRGDHNTVLRSRLYESRSWNMKLASDTAADDLGGNTAQSTDFKRAAAPAIVNRQTGSGPFCSDTFDGRVSEGNSIGNPTSACPDTAAPSVPVNLKATATSPNTVTLTWTASTDDVGVASYRVLRGGAQVGTSTTTSFSNSGLTANTPYSYTVVALDAAGNVSQPSTAGTVTTPATRPETPTTPPGPAQVITVEAESGTVASGMAKRTDTAAQGGSYVSQTSGSSTGTVTLTVNVTTAGRYAFAGRVIAPNSSSDSFTYRIDSGATTTWNLGTRTSWTWVTGPTLTLTAGQHRVVIGKRENGARLDAIRLTSAA
jgi:hypothetical protein